MNINELNRIKAINVEERVADVERGSGTFKEILDNVMSGVIIPLVDNSGRIIGINFDTKVENLIEDSIEQRKFELRYSCKPIMGWVMEALKIKADGKQVASVTENAEEGIKVTTTTGEVIVIEEPYRREEDRHDYTDELPEELDIPVCEIEDGEDTMKGVKKYLRNTYGHYLSGVYGDPEVEYVEDEDGEEIYRVSSIHWGRKI